MTGCIFVSRHAVDRYIERVDGSLTWEEADAEIRRHAPAIIRAADFGCRLLRLGNGAKLVLDERKVVTVLSRWQMRRVPLEALA